MKLLNLKFGDDIVIENITYKYLGFKDNKHILWSIDDNNCIFTLKVEENDIRSENT